MNSVSPSISSLAQSASSQVTLDDCKERQTHLGVNRRILFSHPSGFSAPSLLDQMKCPKGSDTILRTFKRSLKEDHSGAVLKSTAHGSSGYTLLGNGPVKAFAPPSAAISDVQPEEQVGIVLKWIPQRAAKDEYACNELAKAFGLEVPIMQPVSKETSALFVSPTKRQKPSFNESPFQLIAMNRIEGMNLSQLCSSGAIFRLKPSSWQQMMYQFGKAAMLDLFSGNFDRFVRFQMNEKGVYEFIEDPEANAGNVMIHTTPERGNIASVAFIDNTSLAPPSKPAALEDPDEAIDLSLFDSDKPKEPEVVLQTPPKTPEKQDENPAIVRELNAFFVNMTQELERDANGLAEHIAAAVKKAISKSIKEEMDMLSQRQIRDIEFAMAMSHKSLKEGLLYGLRNLQNPVFQEAALSIAGKGSKSLNELIRLNILSLKQNELDLSTYELETESVGTMFSPNTPPPPLPSEVSSLVSTSVGSLDSTELSVWAGQ
jgi:hypothetical protein